MKVVVSNIIRGNTYTRVNKGTTIHPLHYILFHDSFLLPYSSYLLLSYYIVIAFHFSSHAVFYTLFVLGDSCYSFQISHPFCRAINFPCFLNFVFDLIPLIFLDFPKFLSEIRIESRIGKIIFISSVQNFSLNFCK